MFNREDYVLFNLFNILLHYLTHYRWRFLFWFSSLLLLLLFFLAIYKSQMNFIVESSRDSFDIFLNFIPELFFCRCQQKLITQLNKCCSPPVSPIRYDQIYLIRRSVSRETNELIIQLPLWLLQYCIHNLSNSFGQRRWFFGVFLFRIAL